MTTQTAAPKHGSIADLLEAFGRLMTAKELCPILAMSKSTLYDRAKAGTIPTVNIGGTDLRFDPFTIAAWLRAHVA